MTFVVEFFEMDTISSCLNLGWHLLLHSMIRGQSAYTGRDNLAQRKDGRQELGLLT